MYNNGDVDIRVLKDILGHEQLTTTQIYTHVSDKKLEEAMAANPLAKEKQTITRGSVFFPLAAELRV